MSGARPCTPWPRRLSHVTADMPTRDKTSLRRRTARIAAALENAFGDEPHLDDGDPLDCLIHCILSQNTTSANCGRAYENLRQRFPTWEEALAARSPSIAKAIRIGGLANQKSRWIKDVLRWVQHTQGKLSLEALRHMTNEEAVAWLTSVRGVGLKTAAIVLCFGCGRDVFPVDTHVRRVCKRLGLVPFRNTRERTFRDMAPLVPTRKANSFHLNMVHLGRTVCRARQPQCTECPAAKLCDKAGPWD